MATQKSKHLWRQNALQIAALFELEFVFVDFFGPAVLFSNHVYNSQEELSLPHSELAIQKFIKATGRNKSENWEIKLVHASMILGLDVAYRVAAYEAHYKKPFPHRSAHEQLEAMLTYREGLEELCRENGVPVPAR